MFDVLSLISVVAFSLFFAAANFPHEERPRATPTQLHSGPKDKAGIVPPPID